MSYKAPVKDMLFTLQHVAGLDRVTEIPRFEDANLETASAVLEECARFNEEVVAPLNAPGDENPSTLKNGVVTTAAGFKDAFKQFAEGGWQGIVHPTEVGGAGLPKLLATPCTEMLNAANLSFALCPLLSDGAIEALMTAGSDEQRERIAPRLVSGEWTGSMNLTEPQAGSDLSMVRSKAEPQGDGSFRISGQKIFITYGEHDMTENIVHLVLARTPDAPAGVKGISLFAVPKFLINDDGSLGKRNDVWCSSIEHKLGIKASPTAILLFGDDKGDVGRGAIGHLVGEENSGLKYMFIMMNAARFAVGVQGISIADRAYQLALAYARDRKQSRDVAGSSGPVTIINHPDVRRMLMTMKSSVEAARTLAYTAAAASDLAHHDADPQVRKEYKALYELLVPIVKGWSTEMSLEVTSLGVQVHGGMGFIEETGAAQHYRDARILTIYEGTTAIQANDLIGRKTSRDGGAVMKTLLQQVADTEALLLESADADLIVIAKRLANGREAMVSVVDYIVDAMSNDVKGAFAGSVPYLRLSGIVLGGWQLARAALAAKRLNAQADADHDFMRSKIATARFFADHLLVQADGLAQSIVAGSDATLALTEAQFQP